MSDLKEKAKTTKEIELYLHMPECLDWEWVRLEDAEKEIDFQKARVDVANEMVTSKQKRIDELKQKLQQELVKCKKIEKETSSPLWREGARWNIRLIEELLKEEKMPP